MCKGDSCRYLTPRVYHANIKSNICVLRCAAGAMRQTLRRSMARSCQFANGRIYHRPRVSANVRSTKAGAGTFRALRKQVERSAAELGDRAKESWRELDSRWGVTSRLKHSKEDIQRMLPYWRRRFQEFSNTRAGRATLWAAFVYSIISGLLFRALSFLFLLWWVVPLIMIPFMRRNIAKAQEHGYGGQGRTPGVGSNPPPGFGGFSGFGAPPQSRGGSQGYGSQGPVIDAEWSSVDSNDSGRSR